MIANFEFKVTEHYNLLANASSSDPLSFHFDWSYCSDKQQITYVLWGTSTFYFWDWLDKQNTLTCLRRINYVLYAHVQ